MEHIIQHLRFLKEQGSSFLAAHPEIEELL